MILPPGSFERIANSRFIPGLVSVTFRNRGPEEIVALAAKNGLRSIEWGSDIHVPPGDLANAERVRQLCAKHQIAISAYGSYYRAGATDEANPDFGIILETARHLGADLIRVWAGNVGSSVASAGFRNSVVADLRNICRLAAEEDCSISLEFHGGTLTDTADSAARLLADVNAPNLSSYWQPPNGMPKSDCLAGLQIILPWLKNVHIFHWWPDPNTRLPLSEGIDRWSDYLRLAQTTANNRHVSLEFVRGDDAAQLAADARSLINLLDTLSLK